MQYIATLYCLLVNKLPNHCHNHHTTPTPTRTPTHVVGATASKSSSSDRDKFLGLLFPADEHRLYGYVTSTNIKLVLVVCDPSALETDIKKLFRTIHDAYISLVSNPFYKPDSVIESTRFDAVVTSLLAKSKD
eukprot:m.27005 g.27005  ORF g.27005 m.27005 type:complete len:133 (+) comp4365_c0_seq2:45-443(+)